MIMEVILSRTMTSVPVQLGINSRYSFDKSSCHLENANEFALNFNLNRLY